MRVAKDMSELIGHTPMVRLDNYCRHAGVEATLIAKLECMNPGGSAKERIGAAMIQDALDRGLLQPGGTIIEPTSGNTGIALAALAAAWGYRMILTMPDSLSMERRQLLSALGAQIVLTPAVKGMAGAIERAQQLKAEIPGSYIPDQFDNPANPEAHYRTTGPEILWDMDGRLDLFVAGIGTGGTITGVARALKEHDPAIRVVGMEPAESAVLSGGKPGLHGIQGLGAGFVPPVLDLRLVDEVVPVNTQEAMAAMRLLARSEGLICGISSGGALVAASRVAARPQMRGKTLVVLLPDTGERYLSTGAFDNPN